MKECEIEAISAIQCLFQFRRDTPKVPGLLNARQMSHDLKPRGGEGGLFHSHSKERPPADTANKKMLSLKIAGISSQQIREMNSARSAVKVIRKPRHFDGIGAYYGASPPLPPSVPTFPSWAIMKASASKAQIKPREGRKGEIPPTLISTTN